MRNLTSEELKEILEKHQKWIRNEDGGERANLSWANLSWANLYGANLSWANLYGANLSGANLSWADLSWANLYGANLYGANLSWANLSGANLSDANLSWANLYGANLSGANLYGANLSGANLSWADLSWANLYGANLYGAKNVPFIPYACPDFGAFVGYKKAKNKIVQLEILSDARRCSATGRKCRCDKAKVLSITNLDGSDCDEKEVSSDYDKNFVYKVGEIVSVDDFCENRWNECSEGIHFFINRQEAVNYN